MAGFDNYAFAARFRDLVGDVAEKTVSRMRPEPRIGKVHDFSPGGQTADILFAGEINTVKVRFASNLCPTKKMMDLPDGSADADIVRVAGKTGKYYISDFIYGAPAHFASPGYFPVQMIGYDTNETGYTNFSTTQLAIAITFPAVNGAVYRVTGAGKGLVQVAGNFITLLLKEEATPTGVTGNVIQRVTQDHRIASRTQTSILRGRFTYAGVTGTNHTAKLTIDSNGLADSFPTAAEPMTLEVERVG